MKRGRIPGTYSKPGRLGPLWFVDVHWHGRRYRRAASPNTQGGAARMRIEAEERIARGEHPFQDLEAGHRGRQLTVGAVVQRYKDLLAKTARSAGATRVVALRAKNLTDVMGSKAVASLDETALLEYRNARELAYRAAHDGARELRPATLNRELEFLRAALNSAKDVGLLRETAFDHLSRASWRRVRPEEIDDDPRAFRGVDDKEFEAIVAALPKQFHRPVRLLFLVGARAAEVLSLDWSQVRKEELVFLRTKGKRTRSVPLTDEIRALLGSRTAAIGLVFPAPRGGSLVDSIGAAWQRARAAAKLPWIKVHHLRAERASRMKEAGVADEVIREICGWSENSPVPKRYIRPSRQAVRAAIEGATAGGIETGGRIVRFPG